MPNSLNNTFRVFKSRNYSLFFTGQLISRIGMWMQRTAVIWVIYSMTHSAFMLGLTAFAEQFPSFIFSPLGGIIADRYPRFRVLMVTQVISALQAVALAALYFTGYHQPWLILSLSVVLGIANAFDIPARQPLVNDIISTPDDLPNAIAMNASLNNLARLIGPALSGIVLALYGAGICFTANAFSFVAVIASLALMKLPRQEIAASKKKISTDFTDGLAYIKSNPDISTTLLLLGLICFFAATYNTLIPIYAKEIFKGNAATFGYISGFIGAGAVISAVYLATLKPKANLKRILLTNTCILGISLIIFSHISYFPLAMLPAILCGFGTMSVVPLCNTIVQVASAPHMRGRVISFFAMAAFGTLPLGSLVVGWLSGYIGVQNTILCQGIIAIAIAGIFAKFFWKQGRKIPQEPAATEIEV